MTREPPTSPVAPTCSLAVLVLATPAARLFIEAWVRFVEPRDINSMTLVLAGVSLAGIAAVAGAPVLDVFGYGLVTMGMVTLLLTD